MFSYEFEEVQKGLWTKPVTICVGIVVFSWPVIQPPPNVPPPETMV